MRLPDTHQSVRLPVADNSNGEFPNVFRYWKIKQYNLNKMQIQNETKKELNRLHFHNNINWANWIVTCASDGVEFDDGFVFWYFFDERTQIFSVWMFVDGIVNLKWRN